MRICSVGSKLTRHLPASDAQIHELYRLGTHGGSGGGGGGKVLDVGDGVVMGPSGFMLSRIS